MTTPTTNSVVAEAYMLSGNGFVDPLLGGSRWMSNGLVTSLSYSFAGPSSTWARPYSQLNEPAGTQRFGLAEMGAARAALQAWSGVAGLSFRETGETSSNVGDIRFAYTSVVQTESAAHAYLPSNFPSSGDIWVDTGDIRDGFSPGSSGYLTLLHEIGHALGLKHPFEAELSNQATLDPEFDSIGYTVMSYSYYQGMPVSRYSISILPTTPMLLDIAAMQYMYGPGTANAGDNQYVFNADTDYFQTIYDTGGNDTIISTSDTQYAIIDLHGGSWSSLGNALELYDRSGESVSSNIYDVAIYFDSVIENAVSGGADDELYGNDVGNGLDAGGGHDTVWGGGGADTVLGGAGNDHLYGQSPQAGADGADSILGGDGSDYIQGNAGNDTLDGGDGSDRINGGQNDDSIAGGAGNDTINGNRGADTIFGGEGNDSIRGGQDSDSIAGGDGSDTLSGDLGSDSLSGGSSADLFVFGGTGSALTQPDRVLDFEDGIDRLAIGFVPAAVLNGAAQTDAAAASSLAQQLVDGHAGNAEVAAVAVGSDLYLFYASGAGTVIDAAIILGGSRAFISGADFA